MHILVITHEDDYGTPSLHGPFKTTKEAQTYAEDYRELVSLPREATPENNETWTDAGWYFGIFEPEKITF